MTDGHFEKLYEEVSIGEKETRTLLIRSEQNYPGILKDEDVNEIAADLQRKTDSASILAKLRRKKAGK